ncbi:uncharacterized protein CANTADRAFT_89343 [Suhomyces tanzawaensis NRRL Y-17324]|uniref:Vacuolar membrane protein n=1 Tax=Suhomyces tanzawaensis NRRL Y-17324 TaxID=984487 RepID=A0A1E4SJM1_9ASCO|nr:uncharacterized protein CANTADRAFT_89343 [Suhomyces tanzawaensis NRRL Y-17324]ODV79706.1 hypothetical protein CANTADRAFT_89343 [Suhomyces tanzawaensis NRRL Y-17324]
MLSCNSLPVAQLLSLPIIVLSAILPVSFDNHIAPSDNDDGKCELIGTFSLLTQAVLGLLCLSSLLVKRYYEFPIRRTWSVWLFDVLKQLIGALGVHVFNVFLSIVKTRKSNGSILDLDSPESDVDDDPCDWYFLSIVFDCTIGVYILYLVFQSMTKFSKKYLHMTQIDSGNYGPDPNKPSTRAFLKQLSIYFISLMITKILIYGIVECFEQQLLWFTSHVLLLWLDEYPDEFEIFVVMFVVPIVMNCLQLVLIDNFIQNQAWMSVNKRIQHEHHLPGEPASVLREEAAHYLQQEEHANYKAGPNNNSDSSISTFTGDEPPKSYGTFNQV